MAAVPTFKLHVSHDSDDVTFSHGDSDGTEADPMSPSRTQEDATLMNSGTSSEGPTLRLPRPRTLSHGASLKRDQMVDGFVFVGAQPENEIEAQRISQNYMFGFKKWKSHLTPRPLSERSDVVKELYAEPKNVKPSVASTISVGNVLYCLLFGWWVALVYVFVAFLMLITIIGKPHGKS